MNQFVLVFLQSCQSICMVIDMEHYGFVSYDTASMGVQFLALQETLCLHL